MVKRDSTVHNKPQIQLRQLKRIFQNEYSRRMHMHDDDSSRESVYSFTNHIQVLKNVNSRLFGFFYVSSVLGGVFCMLCKFWIVYLYSHQQ